jgi:hypothetical protein
LNDCFQHRTGIGVSREQNMEGRRMWALLSRRLRRWLLIAVGIPVLAWLLERLGDGLEARNGRQTVVSRNLRRAGGWLGRSKRAPQPA